MKNSYKIGLVFLGSILLLYLFIIWGTQTQLFQSNTTKYFIDFENVNGLKVSDPVLIRGLEVGRVANIELKDEFCRVEIILKNSYSLKNQTKAEIQIRELLSGKQLVLFPDGNQILPNGSIIKGSSTFDFSYALSKMGKLIQFLEQQNFDFQKFNLWIHKIDTLFQNPYLFQLPEQLSHTLLHIDQITLQLQQKKLIVKFDSVTTQIQNLLSDFSQTQKKLDEILLSSKPIVGKMDTTFNQLDSVLIQSKSLLTKLNESIEKIQNQETAMNAMLFKEDFYKDIQKTLQNLNITLDHIREKRIRVLAKIWGKE